MLYAVTGATGQLGRLVIEALGKHVPASQIVALVRDPAKADENTKSAAGSLRGFDYDQPESLLPALEGVKKLLLISSNAMGKRTEQHKAVIDAAKAAGVEFIAYTAGQRRGLTGFLCDDLGGVEAPRMVRSIFSLR